MVANNKETLHHFSSFFFPTSTPLSKYNFTWILATLQKKPPNSLRGFTYLTVVFWSLFNSNFLWPTYIFLFILGIDIQVFSDFSPRNFDREFSFTRGFSRADEISRWLYLYSGVGICFAGYFCRWLPVYLCCFVCVGDRFDRARISCLVGCCYE